MMERSSVVELNRLSKHIIATAEAYLREKVAVKNSNNNNKEDLTRLEKVVKLLEIGSSKLNEAINNNCNNDGKRKELLEQAVANSFKIDRFR